MIVCRDIDAAIIETVIKQIGWGQRVRGIVKESELTEWYERCLRGKFADLLAPILMRLLSESFEAEFPEASEQAHRITQFCQERGYTNITSSAMWRTAVDV